MHAESITNIWQPLQTVGWNVNSLSKKISIVTNDTLFKYTLYMHMHLSHAKQYPQKHQTFLR